MSGLGKKSKILAKIKHFFKCVKWSKQRITRGYCDCDVWEMFSFLQTLIPDMLQTLKDTRTGSPGYLGENYTNENGILVNDTCHEEWNCILDKMIFLWREAEKDTCSQKNPFDEAHSKAMDEFTERFGLFGNKLQTEKELEENRKRGGGGTIIEYLLSDAAQIEVWPKVKKHLTAGKTLYFSHGFAITYKERTGIVPPTDVDVVLVAPKGSGTSLRRMFLQGRGLNSSYAIFQDATGHAKEKVIALGIGVGSGYLFETTFKREVYSDLTGERGTLMGAIQGIFAAQYDTLRAHGHSPSEAFNETVEELTQSLMPLVAENGMDWMYANCSTTAQRGALDWWKKFRDATKPVFEELYEEVAKGNEAQRSIDTNSKEGYRDGLNKELKELRESEMWQAGVTVRKLRPENN